MLALTGCAPPGVVPAGSDHPAVVGTEAPRPAAPAARDEALARWPAEVTPRHLPGRDHDRTRGARDERAAIAAAEQATLAQARPVFERHCARCHTAGGAKARQGILEHFDMTGYPFGGHHADEVGERVRRVLGVTGEPPTMPRDEPGAVQGAELEAVIAWTVAFDRAQAAGLHGPAGGEGHDHEAPAPADGGHGEHGGH